MSKEKPLDILNATLAQIRLSDPYMKKRLEKLVATANWSEEQKEIARRLKIQNKKLLEQVLLLKKRLKKNSAEKAKMFGRLKYLKTINKSLSETFGSCPKCGEKILPGT